MKIPRARLAAGQAGQAQDGSKSDGKAKNSNGKA